MSNNSTTILGSSTALKTSTVTSSTKTTSTTTTSTLTSSTATKCLDSDPNICPQYAAVGYCVYSSVQNYCPFSCKICIKPITVTSTSTTKTTSTTAKCLDSDSNICPQYAAVGYCVYSSVQNYCPFSCKICS
jgi:hypothetical protein